MRYEEVARELRHEISLRKLTERQQKILHFILRLSYECQKDTATIPLLSHFELCGVRLQDAKTELQILQNSQVIRWEGQEFTINPNSEEWQINYVKGWDSDKFNELLLLNGVTKSVTYEKCNSKVTNSVNGHNDSYEMCKSEVTKSVSQDAQGYEMCNPELTKSVTSAAVENDPNPCGSKGKGVSPEETGNSLPDNIVIKSFNLLKDLKDLKELKIKELYIPSAEIVNYLNDKCGTRYKAGSHRTVGLIKARVSEGFTLAEFYKVIDNKTADWLGTEYEKYLRPETLFGNKFEGYLNQKGTSRASPDLYELGRELEEEMRQLA